MKYLILLFLFFTSFIDAMAQKYPLRVAILGNSIVGHGPAPNIGWNGDWGMAASAKEKDFVRLIEKDLKAISTSIEVKELNIADFEKNYQGYKLDNPNLNTIKNFTPDILVIRIGENLEDWNLDIPNFHKYLKDLVNYVASNRPIRVIVTNSFWSSATRDYAFQSFIEKNNYRFVDLSGLYAVSTNTAQGLFTDIGVQRHPSDKGMQAIKDRIWKELSREVDDLICNYYQKCNYCQEGDYVGYLDTADCNSITGWVLDKANVERLVEVEISIDDKPYINVLANLEYPDLAKYYGANATKHGFKYVFPAGNIFKDGLNHTVKVKPCWKDGKPLTQSGKVFNCPKPEPPKVYVPDYVSGWISTECDEVIGWIYDKNDLTKTVKIDFLLNDKIINSYQANLQRPELLTFVTANPDAIKHIFVANLPVLAKGNYTFSIKLPEDTKIIGEKKVLQCPKIVLSKEEENDNKILIFPNPNHGIFKLLLPNTLQNTTISIFDNVGRDVKFSKKGEEILIENGIAGMYFLKILKGEKVITYKIIVD
jgi:Secretion system C-terminal sorting domain